MSTCKEALESNKIITDSNITAQDKYNQLKASYDAWSNEHKLWSDCFNQTNGGCKSKFQKYQDTYKSWISETKDWNTCVDEGTAWGTFGAKDGYCSNDIGQGWKHLTNNKSGHGCSGGLYKGVCQRSPEFAKSELQNHFTYWEKEPQGYGGDIWLGKNAPVQVNPIPVANLYCCQDIGFQNIDANKIKFDIVTNTCTINDDKIVTKVEPPSDSTDDNIFPIIIIVIIVSIMLSCSIAIVVYANM